MAFKYADRVQETTVTSGTGTLALAGAVAGFRTFTAALSSGDTCAYCISDPTTGDWEVGIGTFTSPATLARTTIQASSNAGGTVNLSSYSKNVFITLGAGSFSQTPGANQIPVVKDDGSIALPPVSGDLVTTLGSVTANADGSGSLLFQAAQHIFRRGSVASYAEVGRFDTSGNLLVGVTSGVYHTFAKNSPGNYIAEFGNSSPTTPWGIKISLGAVANSTGYFLNCIDSGATRFLISGNGNATNVNNSYGAISDIKLKENVEAARNYLADLCGVRVVKYSLIADEAPAATHLGVIAQELEQIFPGMVEETPDMGERQVEIGGVPQVDDEGNPIMERYDLGTTTKSVKYSVFVPMLITAVQELSARVAALEAQLNA